MRDLLVVGGGPVGLAAALYAARAGLDVGVREPRPGPVDKACGEGLMPGGLAALQELGVDPPGRPLTGIRYVDAAHAAEAAFRHGTGRGVRRTSLHAGLSAAVAAAGVTVEQRSVREVRDDGSRVLVDGEPARYVIAADGLHSPVRRALGLAAPPRGPRRYGQRVHVEVAPWTSYVEVHWARSGEAYVTPVAEGLVGVAVLSALRRPWEDALLDFPRLRERIDGAARSRPRGAGPLRQRTIRRVAGRVLLVGDAAGYVDALTGEGISLGLAHARAAVDAVRRDDPAAYEAQWRRLGRSHVLLTRSLLALTRPTVLRDRVVPLAAGLPVVFGAAVNALARPA